jgi:hypothetical protein
MRAVLRIMNLSKGACMKVSARTWLASAALAVLPATADAQMLQLLGQSNLTGGGLGAVNTVLTLQNPGGTNAESGCVGPQGFVGCGFTNANVQQGQSQVVPLSQLNGLTGSNFRLFLNAAEPGNDNTVTLNSLVVTLYGSGNATWSASYGPQTLTNTSPGIGNYGFLFGIASADQAAFNAFLAANPNAVIGVGASLTNVDGGPETFSVGMAGSTTVVPEPSTYLLMASGLAGVLMLRRRRKA